MKRAVIYTRVSTVDQNLETQLLDLRQMAAQRGYQIIHEYTDRISGTKVRRPGLDQMMADARHGRFDVVLVWACDRIARSTRHFLAVLDELRRLDGRASETPGGQKNGPKGKQHEREASLHRAGTCNSR